MEDGLRRLFPDSRLEWSGRGIGSGGVSPASACRQTPFPRPCNDARMTLANRITIFRLLLIPVFVWLGLEYGATVRSGEAQESLRLWAILVFVVAALSDALDGWVARRFDQQTQLGMILDPIADKGLMLCTLLVLSFAGWAIQLPIWFTVLVISRDVAIISASLLLRYLRITAPIRPSVVGKISTATQMIAIAWVMLQIEGIDHRIPVAIAAGFTILSWLGYFFDFMKHLQNAPHER